MLIEYSKEKLINAIIYFTNNTNHCGKSKLNVLLYLIDFKHYGLVGRNVTGLDYHAGPEGPFPIKIHESVDGEIKFVASDDAPNAENSRLDKIENKKYLRCEDELRIKPLKKFNGDIFTKREQHIMKKLVDQYENSNAKEIIETIYLNKLKWHEVLKVIEKRQQKTVPYDLALNKQEKEILLEIILENKNYWQKYQ